MLYFPPKARRRSTILFAALLLLMLGGWGAYRVGQHRNAVALASLRAQAMADYAGGNRRAALGELGDYLARSKQQDTDSDALLAYAMCRGSVELPGHRNVIEAIGILAHYREMRPNDVSAAHTLLEWYRRVQDYAEALDLSNALLAAAPDDLEARTAKIEALWGLSRLPEALAESQRLNTDEPTLLKGQLMTTYLLMAMDRGDKAVRRAEKLCDAHPIDARFELVRGAASMLAGKTADARTWLAAAAGRDTADADFAMQECRFLDAVGLFDDTRDLLARTARRAPTPELVNQFLLREYQDRGPAALLGALASLPVAVRQSSGALGLEEAAGVRVEPSLNVLKARTDDAVASGWSIAIAAHVQDGDPAKAAAAYREALQRDPANAIVADWLAGAEAEMGERELALAMWRRAATACPNWARPCVEMATTLETLGRPVAALEAARAAEARSPGSFDTQFVLAGAMVSDMPRDASDSQDSPVLPMLARMMQQWPARVEVLPLYASALVRTGQPQAAAEVIERSTQSSCSPGVLLALVGVNDEAHLNFRPMLEEKLRSSLSASAQSSDPISWKIAMAAYRDAVGDSGALAAWKSLGDAFPNDVRVQSTAIQSPSRFGDRAFWQRTIDRLHALVGEQGLTWRTEQARWILADSSARPDKDKELAQAVTLVQEVCRVAPDWADARHLLGIALQQTGNISSAIDEFAAAADLAPADADIVADLSQLLRQTGRTDEASAVVRRLAACPILTPQARRWADQATLADQVQLAIGKGDLHRVESDCRRMLALGASPDACNDLAYALLLEGRPQDQPEALRLAERAVSLSPSRSEYRDTLQRIESKTPNARKIPVSP
jgi:tetratricopeptide (TPR) repeat protein